MTISITGAFGDAVSASPTIALAASPTTIILSGFFDPSGRVSVSLLGGSPLAPVATYPTAGTYALTPTAGLYALKIGNRGISAISFAVSQ